MSIRRGEEPVGPTALLTAAEAHEAAREALCRGRWRRAHELAERMGGVGIIVNHLAQSMQMRAVGLVKESWDDLVRAAVACDRTRPAVRRSTCPGDPAPIPWPDNVRDPFIRDLIRIGRREEAHARAQWHRIENATLPKRAAVIEACLDHLMSVEHDRYTWSKATGGEWLPNHDRVTRGRYGECGQDYFVRRANELYQWVFPGPGQLTKAVWCRLQLYRGVRAEALAVLAFLADAPEPEGIGHRDSYRRALQEARHWRMGQ